MGDDSSKVLGPVIGIDLGKSLSGEIKWQKLTSQQEQPTAVCPS
jgi:hypothetical protein